MNAESLGGGEGPIYRIIQGLEVECGLLYLVVNFLVPTSPVDVLLFQNQTQHPERLPLARISKINHEETTCTSR